MKVKYSHIIIELIINFYLYPSISCKFRSMKKISEDGDYFVILDSGIYIHNFEKSKQINIKIFNESIFETNDEYNQIIISKNQDDNSNEIKIAALINHHLYIYTYDDSNNKLEHLLIDQLKDPRHLTYSFHVEIKNLGVTIYFVKKEPQFTLYNYRVKSIFFPNYLSIKENEPNTETYFEKILQIDTSFFCQIDEYDSSLICLYGKEYCVFFIF